MIRLKKSVTLTVSLALRRIMRKGGIELKASISKQWRLLIRNGGKSNGREDYNRIDSN